MATATEAKLKEKQAMSLVAGLQADIEALQSQVRSTFVSRAVFNCCEEIRKESVGLNRSGIHSQGSCRLGITSIRYFDAVNRGNCSAERRRPHAKIPGRASPKNKNDAPVTHGHPRPMNYIVGCPLSYLNCENLPFLPASNSC